MKGWMSMDETLICAAVILALLNISRNRAIVIAVTIWSAFPWISQKDRINVSVICMFYSLHCCLFLLIYNTSHSTNRHRQSASEIKQQTALFTLNSTKSTTIKMSRRGGKPAKTQVAALDFVSSEINSFQKFVTSGAYPCNWLHPMCATKCSPNSLAL